MIVRVGVLGACLAVSVSATGCALGSDGVRSTIPLSDRASTPTAAALGFDISVLTNRSSWRFGCLPDGKYTFMTLAEAHPSKADVSVARQGATWVVTVKRAYASSTGVRYQVSRRDGGYCVSKLLPDLP